MQFIRRNAIALVALVFAMTGTGLAASHYVINSTSQINPKVLKKLKGRTGKTGPAGPAGAAGLAGKAGTNGTNGTNGQPGAPGSAAGWAYVESNGEIAHRGGAVAIGIHKEGTGVYCLELTPRQEFRAPILATIQGQDFTKAIVSVNTAFGSVCNASTGIGVFTMNLEGKPADAEFSVALMANVPST